MPNQASVFNVEEIHIAMLELPVIKQAVFDRCDDGIRQAITFVEETQREEKISKGMLEAAKVVEAAAHAVVIELEGRLAVATVEASSAAASGNLPAAALAGAEIAELTARLIPAREEYINAKRHREALEHRYDLAVKCMNIAQERLDFLRLSFETGKVRIETVTDKGCLRLNAAYRDLTRYISRIAPDVRRKVHTWFNKKPEDSGPVRPNEVRDKLDTDEHVTDAVLEYLYTTDPGFRANVDGYCNQMRSGDIAGAELKIKKQMVGRLCEEIVIRAFKPISSNIETQARESLPDGRYTKVDLIVYGLTNPLILGKGEGMGAREGGSLAVEVKSGHSAYLYQQLSHMLDQAVGHRGCDASCTICTRDIHDLPSEKENELREKLREAGSPMIGMLPRKDELNLRCINFVNGKMKENVQR